MKLNEIITINEIKQSVLELSTKVEDVDVRALVLPPFILKNEEADKLIDIGKIKVGWINWPIVKRKLEQKCYRFWVFLA